MHQHNEDQIERKIPHEFHRFSELPAEIRIKIWIQAAILPQVITFWERDPLNVPSELLETRDHARLTYLQRKILSRNQDVSLRCRSRCPLTQVNLEAQEEALKVRCDISPQPRYHKGTRPAVYANLEIDTLWIHGQLDLWKYLHVDHFTRRGEVNTLAMSYLAWS